MPASVRHERRGHKHGARTPRYAPAMNDPTQVLSAWDWPGPVSLEPADSGNINPTWIVRASEPIGVLQRFNTAIFDPRLHDNIEAVTAHLARAGLQTPRLIRTRAGGLWHEEGQVWRALSWVGDRTVHELAEGNDARSAGALVARFHRAMEGFDWDFRPIWSPALMAGGTRGGFHDTGAYMDRLRDAIPAHSDHRLHAVVARLGDAILADWDSLDRPDDLPLRVVHGDLKISNLRYDGPDAVALIDLDTLSRGTLDAELGDAFRSWCNPAREDADRVRFDLALFEAGIRGYASQAAATDAEWAAIVPGIERIALELASRFARDALEESYFGWDAAFGGRGEHNLLRARGQHALARAVREVRGEAEQIVRRARG